MENKTNSTKVLRGTRLLYYPVVKSAILYAFILIGTPALLQAQEFRYTKPSMWFGGAAGANINFYRGSTQQLNYELTAPVAYHHGAGMGIYFAPLIEYYIPGLRWGVMLQVGYDSRSGSFKQKNTPCNCPADLKTDLGYISVEPSVRFAPFLSNFYLFGGPRLAFNVSKSFTYRQGTNSNLQDPVITVDVKSNFSNVYKKLLSMQIGTGYDIPLSSQRHQIQAVLSPFVSYQPYFGQSPRSIESWNVTTLRAGASLKFGCGRKIVAPAAAVVFTPEVRFSVHSPRNIPVGRRVRETFPLRNYVFFDIGSTEIPDRYVILRKDQVKDFKEDQLEVFAPKNLSGRSGRGMIVYYNILNILGDRMGKNPSSTITLAGRSDVKFEVYGFGEDESLSPFDNKFPEERFYNRTVLIDIIPGK